MNSDEFDKQFDEYRTYLQFEVARFMDYVAVYRCIDARKADRLETLNLAPAFFRVVESAVFTGIILWADKLFDEKGERGFFNFLLFVEHNIKWLSIAKLQRRRNYPDNHWMLKDRTPITFDSINEDRRKIREIEVLKSIRLRRDKFHGHFDKDYFYDRDRLAAEAPIRWQDLGAAETLMVQLVNDYSVDFDGNMYAKNTINIDDLDVLLDYAHRAQIAEAD